MQFTFYSWSDNAHQELWTSSINKTTRCPPPSGLITNKSSNNTSGVGGVGVGMSGGIGGGNNVIPSSIIGGGNSNGWLGVRGTGGPWSGTNTHWNWNWLLLKNLTSQVNFRLYIL